MPWSIKSYIAVAFAALFTVGLAACSPEVGSEEWCDDMEEKDTGDWTANEATDYAKHCVI